MLFLAIRKIWAWSLVDTVNNKRCFIFRHLFPFIIECPPPLWKSVYHQENQKIQQKFQQLFKANLILLANTPTSRLYTDSSPCQVSLTVTTHRPLTFAVGQLNLHWGNIHSIYANREVYTSESTDNEVCKLLALTGETVTLSMLENS